MTGVVEDIEIGLRSKERALFPCSVQSKLECLKRFGFGQDCGRRRNTVFSDSMGSGPELLRPKTNMIVLVFHRWRLRVDNDHRV